MYPISADSNVSASEASPPPTESKTEAPAPGSILPTTETTVSSHTELERSMELIVHITTPDSGRSDRTKVSMGLTRLSARDKRTRKDFYILYRKFLDKWDEDHTTRADGYALESPSEELQAEVGSRLDEQLRAAGYEPDKCVVNVSFNPNEEEELERQQGLGLMRDTSKLVLDDPKDRFVDLTVFVKRPTRRIESGHIVPAVVAWSRTLNGQAQVPQVSQSIFDSMRKLYFVENMVNTVCAHAAKGSTLHANLEDHMKTTLRKLYEDRGWAYDQSLVSVDFRYMPGEQSRTRKAADE